LVNVGLRHRAKKPQEIGKCHDCGKRQISGQNSLRMAINPRDILVGAQSII